MLGNLFQHLAATSPDPTTILQWASSGGLLAALGILWRTEIKPLLLDGIRAWREQRQEMSELREEFAALRRELVSWMISESDRRGEPAGVLHERRREIDRDAEHRRRRDAARDREREQP